MTVIPADVHYAIRTWLRNPGFTAAAIVTLALGIGANTTMFSIVNATLLRRLPFPEVEQLATIWRGPVDNPQQLNVGIETMFSCCGLSTGPRQIVASCSTSGNGSRLSNVALTMENIVVFAPMPSASVTIAAAVKPGFRNQVRIA